MRRVLGLIGCLVFVIVGCGGSAPPPTNDGSATVTGFGATDADWNAHHTADSRGCPGCLYNLSAVTPGNDEYFGVAHDGGRVTGYTLELPVGTSISAAKQRVKAELPADAIVLWTTKRDTCEQMVLQSPALGAALESLGDKTGQVYVELYTADWETGEYSYDVNNINEVFFSLGSYAAPADAPEC